MIFKLGYLFLLGVDELRPIRLRHRISQAHLNPGKLAPGIMKANLSYSARTEQLFVIVPGNQTLLFLSPVTADSPLCPVYTATPPALLSSVCVMKNTDTLLIAKFADAKRSEKVNFCIVALSPDGNKKWHQKCDLSFSLQIADIECERSYLCELPESTMIFGADSSRKLILLRLIPNDQLVLMREIYTPEKYHSLSASNVTLNEQVLVALQLSDNTRKWVSVSRLVSDRLEELSRLPLANTVFHHVLWSGEHLLLAENLWDGFNYGQHVVELDTSRTPLARRAELLQHTPQVMLAAWCTDGDRLIVWDSISNDVLVYSV